MRIAYCLNFGTFSNSTSTIPFNSEQSLIDKDFWKKKNKQTIIDLVPALYNCLGDDLKIKKKNDIPDAVVSNLNTPLNRKCLFA